MSLMLLLSGYTVAQRNQQSRTLVVNGQAADIAVVQINGREYIDLQALARAANGSVGFQGDQIMLTLPSGSSSESAPPPPEHPESGFSQEFMKAGIEEIALLREWASPLAYAIQNGSPVTEQWVAGYRDQAAHGLKLASVAAKTDADRQALQLLTNEFDAVREWSNKLVEARRTMDTAKYAMSETALKEDPLSQKIVACGHFLGTMLGSGAFQDDSSCH
jgi:hypothetical protein